MTRLRTAAAVVGLLVLGSACSAAEPAATLPVATTSPGAVAATLTVERPMPGEVMPSPGAISGTTSTPTVGYRIIAGEQVLAEGTLDAAGGRFSTVVEFSNECCVEMMLEVFQPGEAGLSLMIPVNYPESG